MRARCAAGGGSSGRRDRSARYKAPAAAGIEAVIQAMRHGAHRRFTRRGRPVLTSSRRRLPTLKKGSALLPGTSTARCRSSGVAALAGVAMTRSEAAEAPQLDLVPLDESVGNVVEDRVDDRLRLLLRQVRQLRDFVDQLGFRHRALPAFALRPLSGVRRRIAHCGATGPERHASMPLERMSTP